MCCDKYIIYGKPNCTQPQHVEKGAVGMYKNFERILDRKGLRPSDVSRETGIATSTLTDWKKGRSKPKADKLLKISKYLDVSIEELIGD